MYAGDVLLGAARFYDETRSHPGVTTLETVDLSTFGLCGGTVVTKQCPCGEFTKVSYESECEWEYFDSTEDGGEGYHCYVCGADRIIHWDYVEEGCYEVELGTYDFYKGDEKVYTCTTSYIYENHSYKLTDYEMYGESCEDGILAKGVCTECGKETEEYVDDHVPILEKQIIDLSGYKTCLTSLKQMSCPCGEEWLSYQEPSGACQWHYYWSDKYRTEIAECQICGTVKTWETSYGEKDENCECKYTYTYTYTDDSGNVMAVVRHDEQNVMHNIRNEATLLGESCKDGVIVREYCEDCDYEREGEYNWHYEMVLETYDFSDWDVCFTELTLHGCACGYSVGINVHGGWCNWTMIDADGGEDGYYEIYQCMSCGLIRKESVKFAQGEDACHRIRHITYTYSLEGMEPVTICYDSVEVNHDVERSIKLLEGAVSCEDGVEITETCRNCDYADSWTAYHHETFETVLENADGGKLCGSVSLVTNACACGYYSENRVMWTGEDRCSFSGNYNEEEKCWIYTCHECGAYYKEISETIPDETNPCEYEQINHRIYYAADGTELFSYASSGWYVRHAYVYSYKLIGETCDDGYYMTRYCQRCGYTDEWQDIYAGCETRAVERDVIYSSADICGDIELIRYACACGAEGYYSVGSSCSWSWAGWSEELGGEVYECRICGLQRVYNSEEQRIPGPCKVTRTIYYTLLLDGEVVGSVEKTYEQTEHMTVTVKNLLGETCEDGWTTSTKCIYCDYGYTNDYVEYGHENYRLAVYDLAAYGMCGGYYEIIGCGCGEEEWISNNGVQCRWQHVGRPEGVDGNIYYCEGCGTYETEIYTSEINKEECREYRSTTATYTRNGETVLEFSINYYDDNHEYIYIGSSLNGATCEDGFTAYLQCIVCGESYSTEGRGHGDGMFVMEYIDLEALGSACGGKLGVTTCACGQYRGIMRDEACNGWYWKDYEYTGDARNGTYKETAYCKDCGIQVFYEQVRVTADDSCTTYMTGTATVTLGEYTKVVPLAQVGINHAESKTVYTLAPGSVTCEDGIIATRTCTTCGETETWENTYHAEMVVERIDMSALGAPCGGYIRIMGCACGENRTWNREESECNWYWWTELDEGDYRNGHHQMQYKCVDCGATILEDRTWTTPDDSCRTAYTTVLTVTVGENTQTAKLTRYGNNHILETTCVLMPGSVTCEDGVNVTQICKLCDYSNSWNDYYHRQMIVDRIDLAAMGSICGGEIHVTNCACGADPGWSMEKLNCQWDYWTCISDTGDSRNGKRVDTVECEICDLVILEENTHTTADDSCQTLMESLITVTVGEYSQSFTSSWYNTNHLWERSVALKPDSKDCDDGIIVTDTCTVCGEINSWESSGHQTMELQRIDLTPYGSVCGAELVIEGCACGYNVESWFSDETKCDMDNQWTEAWIEGAIDDVLMRTAHGNYWIESYFHTYTCAVTDPACSLRLRKADYWLAEGCVVTRYIQWQGWDEASQSWVTLVDMETGDQKACHNYTITNVDETLEDGTRLSGAKYDCPDCGSYYYDVYTYYTYGGYKRVTDAKNTLSVGDRKEYYDEYVYEEVLDGHTRKTRNYTSYVYQDGRTDWYLYTYDYKYDEGQCKMVYTYENSGGHYETREEDAHIEISSYEVLREATCTQMGARFWTGKCQICDKVTYTNLDEYRANDHYWSWDRERQTYYCVHCGLENANGASGSIVMEDLTEEYGNGENYVVGYWNRDDIEFMPTISVILDVPEGCLDEVYLEGVEFGYLNKVAGDVNTITAVTFDAATVEAMAAQAVSDVGFSGNYAIRITFLPINGEDELEYAITFDSVIAE